ncbi:MAG: NADH:flavin oxidoreductase/NADH oxidase, partial [Spirochaeta sp.]
MAQLLTPLTLRELTIRNRIGMSPMCMYSSEDGFAGDWHFAHYAARAVGGAGLILTEAAAVDPVGRISPQDLGMWKDAHIPGLQRITRFLRDHGATPGIQLAHAGRKASTRRPWEREGSAPLVSPDEGGWQPVAPSPIAYAEEYAVPEELSCNRITDIVAMFRAAAERSAAAGFQVAEIHAAHGYLLHSFHSPLTNHRQDQYGGSLVNRVRLTREVIRAVREVWPDNMPLLVRISAKDWAEGGWDIDDSVAAARLFKDDGADMIDCSSGGTVPHQR